MRERDIHSCYTEAIGTFFTRSKNKVHTNVDLVLHHVVEHLFSTT